MKKVLPVLLIVAVVGIVVWKFGFATPDNQKPATGKSPSVNSAENAISKDAEKLLPSGEDGGALMSMIDEGEEGDDSLVDQDERPAAQVYKSAEEALKAVKDGATDYNDVVLEQFTLPGEDCAWCPEFYKSLRDMVVAADSTDDQRSYFAEILAISGRVENVSTLVDAIKNAGPDDAKADIYAEGLELTVGKNDVISYLGDQLNNTDNSQLKESIVAAMTNQGTRQSAELLYQQTIKAGDPDGYYKLAIGLGEFVPDEEAIPFLQEMAMKRDQYSHLAVKALLNSGIGGLKVVFDILSSSKDSEGDQKLLQDAIDHISYDEEIEKYLSGEAERPKNKLSGDFASRVLEDFRKAEQEDEGAASELMADQPPQ